MCAKNIQTLFKRGKYITIELWNAKVLLKTIKSQLNVSESTLSRVLAFDKNTTETLVAGDKLGSGRPVVINKNIQKVMKRKLLLAPNTITMQMKKTISGLAHVSVTARQHVSLKKFKLPSRVMVNKPLLTQRIKIRDWNLPTSMATGRGGWMT